MADTPLRQIAYQMVEGAWSKHRTQPGILIASAEIYLLRGLAERIFVVILACPGQRRYHAQVRALLKHAIQLPGTPLWFVSTSPTGPRQPRVRGTAAGRRVDHRARERPFGWAGLRPRRKPTPACSRR
jgi:hypothetical protein